MAEIKIVGTAHVSQQSVDEVRAAIDEFRPDIVAIELDPSRFAALKQQGRDPTVNDVLEVRNFNSLLVQWLLAYLQRKIGFDVGVEPGAEMKAAIEEAERRACQSASLTGTSVSRSCGSGIRWAFLRRSGWVWALIVSIAEVDPGRRSISSPSNSRM